MKMALVLPVEKVGRDNEVLVSLSIVDNLGVDML
jgi:hypothetical protein